MLLPMLAVSLIVPGPCVQADDGARGGRPSLSGPEQIVETDDGAFFVHWTDEGGDQPEEMSDNDDNGLPDGIDKVIVGLTTAAADYEAGGWRTVLPDEGGGGTDGIDVYIRDIDAFGYAYHQPVADGTSCYMELDPRNTTLGDGASESVASHELHHCVQYAYSSQASSWIYEATATYQQYRLFSGPLMELALGVLWNQRLRGMGDAINRTGDRYEYAGFLIFKHLFDRGDGELTPIAVWQALAEDPDWEAALDAASGASFDQSWAEAFGDYAVWNLFACARDDGQHYDPSTHECLFEAAQVEIDELPEGSDTLEQLHLDAPYTALYSLLPAGGDDRPLEIACTVGPDDAEVEVRLVAIDAAGRRDGAAAARAAGGETLELRMTTAVDPAGSFGIVGASVGLVPAELRCGLARVDPEPEPVDEGCACSHGRAPAGGWWSLALLAGLLVRRRPL